MAANASKLLSKLFAQLDAQLAGKSWWAPTQRGDAYLYVVLTWAHGKQVDLTGLDNLAAFFKRMQENSGVKAARKPKAWSNRAARQARQRARAGRRRMMAAWRRLGAATCGASFNEQSDTGGDALVRPARGTSRHARGRAAFRASAAPLPES